MSDKVTEVEAGEYGISLCGHVPKKVAIAEAMDYFEAQKLEAIEALEILYSGKARVFHQLNMHAVKNRREVGK